MAVFDLIIRASRARQGAQEFAQAGRQVTQSAGQAAKEVYRLDKEIDGIGPSSRKAGQDLGRFSSQARTLTTSLGSGVASLRGYVGAFAAFNAARGAIRTIAEFEKGTLQAAKAADISVAQMKGFREELTRISTIRGIEQTSTELAEIAAVAGTLGVRGSDNLTRFTETTAKLTSSLRGLSSEDVATGMGRILQITGEGADGVERFGNVFARLEDSVAGGATEILNASKEVALATARFNVSSTDVLGLGAAFTDIGIQSELARSTLTRTLGAISVALAQGGEDAEQFAELTGQSVDGLRRSFSQNAASTFVRFARGLGAAGDEGREVSLILDELGLSGLRLEPVLTTAAERTEVFADALATARKEAGEQVKIQEDLDRTSTSMSAAFAQFRAEASAFATDETNGGAAGALKGITDQATDLIRALRGADTDTLLGDLVRLSNELSDASVNGLAGAGGGAARSIFGTTSLGGGSPQEDLRAQIELQKQLNQEQAEYQERIEEIIAAERKRVQERDAARKSAVSAGRDDLAKAEEEAQKRAAEASAAARAAFVAAEEDKRQAVARSTESIADQRRAIELLQAELDGADSAGLTQLAATQQIDEQVASMIDLGVSASEYVGFQEESYALAQQIADITREQEAQEAAIAEQKREQAAAARDRAKAEREATQELERQRAEQERAIGLVNQSLGDARFEASIGGLSSEDQQRARELQRFTEQANAAFGDGSSGATSAIGDFKAALDFRDEQREIRELSDAIANDLTGSVRGLSAAFADGKVTSQEWGDILIGVVGDVASTLIQKLAIGPLTDQISNGISGLLSGSGEAAATASAATATGAAGNGGAGGDATSNALAATGLGGLGGAGGISGGSVGTMTVQAATVIVNGGTGGGGGPGGIGDTGLGVGDIVNLAGSISTGQGGLLPSSTSIGAGIPSGAFLSASGPTNAAAFDQQMFAQAASPAAGGGGALGGAGGLGALGGIVGAVGGIASGNDQQRNSGIGQLAGTAIGALIPGIGPLLGPLLGGVIGGLFNEGGYVSGPPRGDDRLIGVGGGEYVLNAEATSRIGKGKLDAANSGRSSSVGDAPVTVGGDTNVSNFVFYGANEDGFRRNQGQIERRQERAAKRRRGR